MIAFIMYSAGESIKIFRNKEINFYHLLEIDFNNRLSDVEMKKVSMIFIFMLNICLSLSIMIEVFEDMKMKFLGINMKGHIYIKNHSNYIGLIVVVFLFVFFFNPFNVMYKVARWRILSTLV